MRILYVCDYYPPRERGGYDQLCADLARGLRLKGHGVVILCIDEGMIFPGDRAEGVLRKLQAPIAFDHQWPVPLQQLFFEKSKRNHSSRVFKQVIADHGIEAVVFWPCLYGDYHLMVEAENMPGLLVAYYIAGVFPTPSNLERYWSFPGRSTGIRAVKSLLRVIAAPQKTGLAKPRMEHVMCVSEFERQRVIGEGAAPENVVVIHNGIEPEQFKFVGLPSARRTPGSPLNVLYAGRLVEDKGAHTAVEAVGRLRQTNPNLVVNLTWLGTGPDEYIKRLDQLVEYYEVPDRIVKAGWIDRARVPEFMSHFDALVLPTIHPEPLARVVQEAMAVGLVVVATSTGGTPEIVKDQETGLLFQPGDAAGLAGCLTALYNDIGLCDCLASNARKVVENGFTMEVMVEAVEHQLFQWQRV